MKLYLAEQDKNHAMVLAFVPKITLGAGMTISILGLLGGFVAMFTLGWRILDQLKAYLHIEIAADMIGNHAVKLKTAIENRQFSARKIDGAFLLVSPLDEDPEESVRKIFSYNRLKHMFSSSNEMVRSHYPSHEAERFRVGRRLRTNTNPATVLHSGERRRWRRKTAVRARNYE